MRTKAFAAATALLVAACSSGTSSSSTTAPPPQTSSTVQATALAYHYQPDSTLTYQVDLDQHTTVHVEGDAAAFEGGQIPHDADLTTQVSTQMTYDISAGPSAGTSKITIAANFDSASVSGTVDGKPVDSATGAGDLAAIQPISVSVVVDDKGNIVDTPGASDSSQLLGDVFGGMEKLFNGELGRPLGPAFPDHPLTVGDSWTDEQKVDGPGGTITTSFASKVLRQEQLDGHDVLVIETTAKTSAVSIDLGDLLKGMLQGMAEGLGSSTGSTSGDQAQLDSMLSQLTLKISADPSTTTVTSWFDPEAGLVRKAQQDGSVPLKMEFTGPDQSTGNLMSYTLTMELGQKVAFRLQGPAA